MSSSHSPLDTGAKAQTQVPIFKPLWSRYALNDVYGKPFWTKLRSLQELFIAYYININ